MPDNDDDGITVKHVLSEKSNNSTRLNTRQNEQPQSSVLKMAGMRDDGNYISIIISPKREPETDR